jgi:hypothetical protein
LAINFRTILERAKISGGKRHKFAEAIDIDKSKVIDYSDPNYNNISTSIDCYVSGHYLDRKGNMLEIKQRYTVYVQYNKATITPALQQVRKNILESFKNQYPGMMIDEVFIPELISPLGKEGIMEEESFYYGSKLFKELSKSQLLDLRLKSAADMYKKNLGTIRDRYG